MNKKIIPILFSVGVIGASSASVLANNITQDIIIKNKNNKSSSDNTYNISDADNKKLSDIASGTDQEKAYYSKAIYLTLYGFLMSFTPNNPSINGWEDRYNATSNPPTTASRDQALDNVKKLENPTNEQTLNRYDEISDNCIGTSGLQSWLTQAMQDLTANLIIPGSGSLTDLENELFNKSKMININFSNATKNSSSHPESKPIILSLPTINFSWLSGQKKKMITCIGYAEQNRNTGANLDVTPDYQHSLDSLHNRSVATYILDPTSGKTYDPKLNITDPSKISSEISKMGSQGTISSMGDICRISSGNFKNIIIGSTIGYPKSFSPSDLKAWIDSLKSIGGVVIPRLFTSFSINSSKASWTGTGTTRPFDGNSGLDSQTSITHQYAIAQVSSRGGISFLANELGLNYVEGSGSENAVGAFMKYFTGLVEHILPGALIGTEIGKQKYWTALFISFSRTPIIDNLMNELVKSSSLYLDLANQNDIDNWNAPIRFFNMYNFEQAFLSSFSNATNPKGHTYCSFLKTSSDSNASWNSYMWWFSLSMGAAAGLVDASANEFKYGFNKFTIENANSGKQVSNILQELSNNQDVNDGTLFMGQLKSLANDPKLNWVGSLKNAFDPNYGNDGNAPGFFTSNMLKNISQGGNIYDDKEIDKYVDSLKSSYSTFLSSSSADSLLTNLNSVSDNFNNLINKEMEKTSDYIDILKKNAPSSATGAITETITELNDFKTHYINVNSSPEFGRSSTQIIGPGGGIQFYKLNEIKASLQKVFYGSSDNSGVYTIANNYRIDLYPKAGLSIGAKIGIAAGVAGLLFGFGIGGFIIIRRRKYSDIPNSKNNKKNNSPKIKPTKKISVTESLNEENDSSRNLS